MVWFFIQNLLIENLEVKSDRFFDMIFNMTGDFNYTTKETIKYSKEQMKQYIENIN